MGLSNKELAAQLGKSEATISRNVADGMPTHSVDAARAWRAANKRARIAPSPPVEGAVAAGPAVLPEPEQEQTYWHSRARREKAEADLAELRLAEQMGELVKAAEVRSAYAKRMAALRESLLQLPARLSPVLAAESDMARCHVTLERELHAVLEQVAG